MPYALFSNDAKLSKAYPTEADVWRLARRSGLVVEAVSEDDRPAPNGISPVMTMLQPFTVLPICCSWSTMPRR